MASDFDKAIEQHDAAIAGSGVEIWIGSEPTFTLRSSEEPHWVSQATGGDKRFYAARLTTELFQRHPGSVILRTVGRQYDGEDYPRWSFGLYERRDKLPVWNGPPDPLLVTSQTTEDGKLESFLTSLEQAFLKQQWNCRRLLTGNAKTRLLVRMDTDSKNDNDIAELDRQLTRRSIHEQKTPDTGLSDPLADQGYYLFTIGEKEVTHEVISLHVELPSIKQVAIFLQCISALSEAATTAGLPQLLIQGFPPPVDHTVSWTTITPDPAVIEINMAPQPDIAFFYAANQELFEIASRLELSPYRLQYNGTVSDSGGGGQFTIGGRTAESSPFFTAPNLLPRLVKYFNLHPSLSYIFATDYVGSGSQSPRADEGTRDAFHELIVALELLQRQSDISPEFLWASFAPFLADASGNSHRSELNIEKLWNPRLPMRGCLGLLEFRAFRMPFSPQRSAAIALLLRATIMMLVDHDLAPRLHDWGDELHERFSLPLFLYEDLGTVFKDLEHKGPGLAPCIQAELLNEPHRPNWSVTFAGCQLSIEQAIDFWPLVGDVASQESGGSRLVDSSTLRLQISLRNQGPCDKLLADWQLQTAEFDVPLRSEKDDMGEVRLIGLKFRDFMPWRGLHPAIMPTGPVSLYLSHPAEDNALEVSLHSWRADGAPYAGLPEDLDEAAQRRAERFIVKKIPRTDIPPAVTPSAQAVSAFTLDLRRL